MKSKSSVVFALSVMGAAQAGIPDSVHPDVQLTEIPLPARYKTMGLAFLPDGRMAIATTDFIGGGEMPPGKAKNEKHKILLVTGATQADSSRISVEEIANSWYQPSGVVVADGKLYVSDRDGFYEIEELSQPADLKANRNLIATWPNENTWNSPGEQWHQWVFTPMYYKGSFYAPYSGSIQLGGPSDVPPTTSFAGAFLKWGLDGKLEKFAGGLRSPNGAGLDEATGEMFVADNEGSWLPSSTFMLMKQNRFYGHSNATAANPARKNWAENLPYEPPVAWLPHGELRASPSQPALVESGIFAGDWLLGDINNPGIVRIALDRVGATPNGAVFFFTNGFKTPTFTAAAAINRMVTGPDGAFYIGTTKSIGGNWPSTQADNRDMKGIYRMAFKAGGPTAFEMKAVRSLMDGLEVEFTLPVDPATVDTTLFILSQQEFKRLEAYGSGEQSKHGLTVTATAVSGDGKRLYLKVPGMLPNRVIHIRHLATLKSAAGKRAWNDQCVYTLNHMALQRAWNPSVGLPEAIRRVDLDLEGNLAQRVSAPGVLSLSIAGKGAWRAELVSPDGVRLDARSGTGAARFEMSRGNARSGVQLLRVRRGGGEVVRKIVL